MFTSPRRSSSFHPAIITPDPDAQSSFYPNLPVSLISSPLPWQLCQHPQASSLKQTIHTAIVHHATPLATGRLRWQLYKWWQSVPEQHWFCSNQSREIATHGKWHGLCAVAYIAALIVAGQTRQAKWWVGPVSVTTVGIISVLFVRWSSVGGPAVTHSSTLSGQTWSSSNKNGLHHYSKHSI